MTTLGHTLPVAATDETERQNFATLLQNPYSLSFAPREFHFLKKCKKTLMDIAVILVIKQKGLAKPDWEKNVRGFSDTVLSFAKSCTVI